MTTITKTRINQVYRRGQRLFTATYHGDIWTTNTYIAEFGRIEPRVYKDTIDYREYADKQPIMDTIIDDHGTVEPVLQVNKYDENITKVETANHSYDYNPLYIDYLVDKYGIDNLLLEPLGRVSKLFAQDDNSNTIAVLAGLAT